MALPATLQWEIRPTNGTANAGGGFDPSVASPGTDYSQQNAVQIAYTDLVIGATTTQLTSVANPFTSAHVGNNIAITSGTGFTAQIFNIRSVSGVTATMDRAVGTAASTGGNGNLGGARNGFSTGTRTVQISVVAGNIIWVKNETWNEAVNLTGAGTINSNIYVYGYDTTRWTNEINAPTGSTRPLLNRGSASGAGFTAAGNYYQIKYLQVTLAGGAGFAHGNVVGVSFFYCRSFLNGGAGFSYAQQNSGDLIGCEADQNTAQGAGTSFAGSAVGCYFHNNTGNAIACNGSAIFAAYCILTNNAANGIDTAGSTTLITNCTINGNTGATSDGIFIDTGQIKFYNNILSNNGRNGAFANSGQGSTSDYNDYFGNTTAARTNITAGPHDIAVDPQFVASGSGNYAIGANVKAKGSSGVFPASTSTGYLSIGAVQPIIAAATVGSAGTS